MNTMNRHRAYRMSSDFMSVFKDYILEVSPIQTCHINIGPVLNGYRATDNLNSR
jgi:hypothetical protein